MKLPITTPTLIITALLLTNCGNKPFYTCGIGELTNIPSIGSKVISLKTVGIADTITAFVSGTIFGQDSTDESVFIDTLGFTFLGFISHERQDTVVAISDVSGKFEKHLIAGRYDIQVKFITYTNLKIQNVYFGSGEIKELNVLLGQRGNTYVESVYNADENQTDSLIFINECSSNTFTSTLEENPHLDSNSFVLTVKSKDGLTKKVHTLNVRPSISRIDYCTEDYTVVSFACGGPCYTHVFVFTKENRPNEQYGYCQRIYGHPNIIAYIKDEEFDRLIIRNLDNGKELIVEIKDNNWMNYGQMDTMYIENNALILNYTSEDDTLKKKIVGLETILE